MPIAPDFSNPDSFEEVELAFNNLNNAIIGHSKWLTEWNTRLICGIPIEQEYANAEAYKKSFFGRWCFSEHADFIQRKPEIDIIKELLRNVHESMSAIVEKNNRGEVIEREEYEHFIFTEAQFTKSVIKLRDEVYHLLLSFDFLTGLLNRQAFYNILEQQYARVIRFDEPCCVVMLDIDHFKLVNDEYGHAAGDEVLKSFAHGLHKNMRPYDSISRFGGEEFLICMPNTTMDMALVVMDRIRIVLSETEIEVRPDKSITVTASFGIAPVEKDILLDSSVEHADQMLYQAKTNGRNRVEVWSGDA